MNRTDHAFLKCGTNVEEWKHRDKHLLATAYDGTTVKDRSVRSRTVFDGFEAALFSFKSVELSQPHCCAGAIGQFLRKRELQNPISRHS